MNFRPLLYTLVLALLSPSVLAKEIKTIATADAGIEVRVFAAQGQALLLGFPCDEGKSIAEEKTAASLAEDGIEVWMTDMLSAYMLPNLRSSRAEIPSEALLAVIDAAIKTGKKVYLIASGPDTELVLRSASLWEASHKQPLSGAVLMFPRLFKSEPVPGVIPEYVDVVGKTRLPLMLMEGERTPNRWGIKSLSYELGKGGSVVTAKLIPNVRGYFFKRQDPNRSEEVVTSQLAGLIKVSLFYLGGFHHYD
ncbi:MAG: hypothetical protein OQL09_09960 [Gammaproteobacteria bacterium]|nr:hypothetical protein [Gammaproteobacteria bacterium]